MVNTGPAAAGPGDVIAAVDRWLAAPGEPEPWVVETSGSTGRPKRVVLSRRAVLASAEASARRVGASGPWVLAVAPTIIDTPGVREQLAPLEAAGVDIGARAAANPLGRIGVADDVARVVLFCCTDMAAFMTGSTLAVDAGTLA